MKKRFLLIITAVLLVFTTACSSDESIKEEINAVIDTITIPETINNYTLPLEKDGVAITWNTNIENIINNDGTFNYSDTEVQLILSEHFVKNDVKVVKSYNTTVVSLSNLDNDVQAIERAKDQLTLPSSISENITLISEIGVITVTWSSSDSICLSNNGIVSRPIEGEDDCQLTLTATFTLNNETSTKDFSVTVKAFSTTTVPGEYTGYYEGAGGLEGTSLKSFLHNLIDDHNALTYSQLWDALADSDEDPNDPGRVILLYSGESYDEDGHGGNTGEWNREHVWAQSHGGLKAAGAPAYTDMHHIRPTKVRVNGDRASLDFDEGGSLVDRTTDCYMDSDSFEPRDEVKGDVARMIFYMAVRYEGDSGELDLELNESVNNSGPYMGMYQSC